MLNLAILTIISFLWSPFQALGSATSEKPPEHGGEKKKEASPSSKPAAKEAHAAEADQKVEGPDAKNALGTESPTRYVHQWLPMPKVVATNLKTLETETLSARKGRVMMVFFVASWCEPCQNISTNLTNLTKRFSRLPVDFYFVFSHDTLDDAKGFMTEHKISEGYLAEFATLKNYNNPELPSVYMSDRQGWLLTRKLKASPKDLQDLQETLQLLTAF